MLKGISIAVSFQKVQRCVALNWFQNIAITACTSRIVMVVIYVKITTDNRLREKVFLMGPNKAMHTCAG